MKGWARSLLVPIALGASACGSEPAPVPSADSAAPSISTPSPAPTQAVAAPKSEPSNETEKAPTPSEHIRVGADGRRMVGQVPLDVWFEDPLAVAGDLTTAPIPAPTENPPDANPTPTPTPSGAAPMTSTARTETTPTSDGEASIDWALDISAEVLDAEVKKIRNRLADALRTPAQFAKRTEEIQADAATLAALSSMAANFGSALSWGPRSLDVRDRAAELSTESQDGDRKRHPAAREAFDRLVESLDGSGPAATDASAAGVPLSQRADRSGLMRRIERSFEWLRTNVKDEKSLKSKANDAGHEMAVLTALVHVSATESYASADEPEYQSHASELVEAGREGRQAAHDLQWDALSGALDRVQKKCDECHGKYRFGQ